MAYLGLNKLVQVWNHISGVTVNTTVFKVADTNSIIKVMISSLMFNG